MTARGGVRVGAVLGALAVFGFLASSDLGGAPDFGRRAAVFSGGGGDTVEVLATHTCTRTDTLVEWTICNQSFTATPEPGRRFVVLLDNGDLDGSHRAAGVTVTLDGREWVGRNEVTAAVASLARTVTLATSNSMTVAITGALGARVGYRVVSVPDCSIPATGPTIYTRAGGSPVTVTTTFVLPTSAGAPFQLTVVNGAADGSQRVASGTVHLNGALVIASGDLGQGIAVIERQVTLQDSNLVEVRLTSAPGSFLTLEFRASQVALPALAITTPAESALVADDSVTVAGSSTGGSGLTVTVAGAAVTLDSLGQFSRRVPLPSQGANLIHVIATGCGGSVDSTRTVIRDDLAPTLVVDTPADSSTTTDSTVVVAGTATDAHPFVVTVNGDTVAIGAGGTFSHPVALALGANTITVVAHDVLGNTRTVVRAVTREQSGPTLPPDPSLVAPALDPTGVTPFVDQTSFLYSGANPIQTGVTAGTITAVRAAVIRGKVLMRDGQPLPGATVSILDHPELGQTLSRADGKYDLAVNGGGVMTMNFAKAGYVPAQRSVDVPWRDYVVADSVALVGYDPEVTAVSFTEPLEVARGSSVTDADGTRRATLMFEQGTVATMVMPDNSTQVLSNIAVRATEFTVGANGEAAMPAPLPPTSAYTYCVDLGVDQAVAAGAKRVDFSKPVPFYLENFLEFPAGLPLPVASYDRERAAWVASPDGRVIGIVAVTGGVAEVDVTGDGQPDSSSVLTAMGLDVAERAQIASLYGAGASLWRVEVNHFSLVDINLAAGDNDPSAPNCDLASQLGSPVPCPNQVNASILECENQVLGESIPVAGTPFTLNYRSYRVPGHEAARGLAIPVTTGSVPANLLRVETVVEVAGRVQNQTFGATPNQATTFLWDGKDPYGRPLKGRQPVRLALRYVYELDYRQAASGTLASFGLPCRGAACNAGIGARMRGPFAITRRQTLGIGDVDMTSAGLGSWSLDVHHVFDPNGRGTLFMGDGRRRVGGRLNPIIASLGQGVSDVKVGPDGSVYLLRSEGFAQDKKLRRIFPNGTSQVIFSANFGFGGDGGPASAANFNEPGEFDLAPDGSIYVADTDNCRLRRIAPNGIVTTVAGSGTCACAGNPGGAVGTTVPFNGVYHVACADDGSVYFTSNCAYLFKLTTDGRVHAIAGTGVNGIAGNGGPASDAQVSGTSHIAVGPDGSVYMGANSHVRRVGPDGVMYAFAGNGTTFPSGDGGPATAAGFFNVSGLEVGDDGSVYFSHVLGDRVRRVRPDGIISTFAGGGTVGGSGGPATAHGLFIPGRMALDQEGRLNLSVNGGLFRVQSPAPGFSVAEYVIPSEDAGEIYVFDAMGRHLRTLDGLTGAARYRFGYDTAHRLVTVTDVDGNVTTVERDGAGNPTAIVGPYGHRTSLSLDPGGYLASVTSPASETVQLGSTSKGLLTSYRDPRGGLSGFEYDALGFLERDDDAAGGVQNLSRVYLNGGYEVTRNTVEGRTTTYEVVDLTGGVVRREVTDPAGLLTRTDRGTNDAVTTTTPDGSTATTLDGPDPRYGMQAPVMTNLTVAIPGGLTSTVTGSRQITGFDASQPLGYAGIEERVTVNGRQYLSRFDAAPRRFTDVTPMGKQTITRVDSAGRPLAVRVAGLDSVVYGYDSRGRLSTSRQGGRQWNYAYDDSGRLERITDPLLRVTGFEYDAGDRLVKQVLPDLREIRYGYDDNGNLVSLTPPGRPSHGFEYTAVDLTERYAPPDVGLPEERTTYAYNRDRQLEAITRPDGAVVDLTYDAAGRLSGVVIPRGTIGFGYSPTSGNLTSLTSPDGVSLSYGYQGSLPTTESWSGVVTGSVSLGYDANLRPVSQSVNGANTVSFGYDNDGLLTSAGAMTLARNAQNGLLTGTTLASVTTSQSYTSAGELRTFDARYSGSSLFTTGYDRDSLGRITRQTETVQGTTTVFEYGYDPAGRLETVRTNGALTHSYGYDLNGNRVSFAGATPADTATGNYDAQDRLLRYGDARFEYTANGELLRTVEGSDTTGYTYDQLGNLITVLLPNGDRIDYLIDGQNRRVGKKLNGILQRQWLYQNGLNVVAELDGSGALVSRFVYGSRGHVPDYLVRGGVTYRLVTDHLGSVRLVVDVATGAVAQRLDYDAWGRVLSDTSPGFQPFGYAGGLWEGATGLVRFGARDYDSEVGRWTCKDPIGVVGDPNAYAYAVNDPVDYSDNAGSIVIADDVVIIAAVAVTLGVAAYYAYLSTPEGQAWLAQMSRETMKIIQSLTQRAESHAAKCNSSPPEDPNQKHWRKEIRAFLDRAERLAKRLPPRQRDWVLQRIEAIRRSIPGL